jgi:uncharacterized protein
MTAKNHPYFGSPVVYKAMGMLDFKADKESRKVSFYAAAFGNKDSDGDIIIRGAFAKSIQEHGPESQNIQKIAYLWMHDMKNPIGRITKLVEDEKGLYVEAIIDNIPEGDRALIQYESGTLNQHSIGFRYMWDKVDYDEEADAYIVKEVQLWEVSVVTLGANENTPFAGMKSADKLSQIENLNKETENLLKSLDQTLSYRMRQLLATYKSLGTAEPDKPTPQVEPEVEEVKSIDWMKVAEQI